MSYPAPTYKFVQASNYISLPAGSRKVLLLVIHVMQAPELIKTAENVADWFSKQPTKPPGSSAHLCGDSDSIIQCVHDKDVAFAAPFANRCGFHYEMAGYTEQSAADWGDDYSKKMLELAADSLSSYALHFEIPAVHLTNDQLKAGWNGKSYNGPPGVIGHSQASDVFKPNNNHRDPGPNFPWQSFMGRMHELVEQKR